MDRDKLLESWKEIAAYIRRSEKTCYRWEHELGLPIHRIKDSPKARVYAYKEELDHWLENTLGWEEPQEKETSPYLISKIKAKLNLKKAFIVLGISLIVIIIAVLLWQLM